MATHRKRIHIGMFAAVLFAIGTSALVFAQQHSRTEEHSSSQGNARASATARADSRSGNGASQGAGTAQNLSQSRRGKNSSMNLYAVSYSLGKNQQRLTKETYDSHDLHIRALMQQDMVYMEGDYEDQTGSLLILRAATNDAAYQAIASDPTVQAGILVPTIKKWHVKYSPFAPIVDESAADKASTLAPIKR